MDIFFALALIVPSDQIGESGSWGLVETSFDGEYDLAGGCLKLDETGDPDTYMCLSAANEVTMTCGSVDVWVCDASGCDIAGKLGSVTSLDATTESTIESAIDTLGDIAAGSIAQGDDKSVCQGADTDWCCEWDTDGTEGLLCTVADCDGLGGSCTAAHVYEDSGNLIADLKGIDSITNSSQKITVGSVATSNYSLGANDMHVTGAFEVDGTAYFDDKIYAGANTYLTYDSLRLYHSSAAIYNSYGSYPLLISTSGVSSGAASGALNIQSGNQTNTGDYPSGDVNIHPGTTNTDGKVGNLNLYTEVAGAGAADGGDIRMSVNGAPGVSTTLVTLDASAADVTIHSNRLAVGGTGGGLGCINQIFSYTDFTDDGGVSGHLDLDDQIPIGAVVQQMILHSLTGFTGDATAVLTAGDDGGADVDRYHSAGTLNVVASAAAGVDCGAPSGTTWHSAAVTVRLVLTGAADFGNFSAGGATISICYWTP